MTIADLVITAQLNPAGVQQGMTAAERVVEGGVQSIIGAFQAMAKQVDSTSVAAVKDFRQWGDALAASLVPLGATNAELQQIDTTVKTLERDLGTAAAEMETFAESRSYLQTLGDSAEGLGYRMNRVGVAALFAFEAFERGGQAGEKGIERVLRAGAMLATAFGPTGWVIAAVLAGIAAVVDHLNQAEKAAVKAAEAWRKELERIAKMSPEMAKETMYELQHGFAGAQFGGGVGESDITDFAQQMAFAIRKGGPDAVAATKQLLQQQVDAYTATINKVKTEAKKYPDLGQAWAAGQLGIAKAFSDATNNITKTREQLDIVNAALGTSKDHIKEAGKAAADAADRTSRMHEDKDLKARLAEEAEEAKSYIGEMAAQLRDFYTQINEFRQGAAAGFAGFTSALKELKTAASAGGPLAVGLQMKDAQEMIGTWGAEMIRNYDRLIVANKSLNDQIEKEHLMRLENLRTMHEIEQTDFFKLWRGGTEQVDSVIEKLAKGIKALKLGVDLNFKSGGVPGVAQKIPTIPGFETGFMKAFGANTGPLLANEIGKYLGGALNAAFGPLALIMKTLAPAMSLLSKLFDELVAPLAAVAEVIVAAIEPELRLLFPIVKDIGIALTYFQEILDLVIGGIARLVGNVVVGIGALIAHIPFLGGVGRAIENAGKSILNFANGVDLNAKEMEKTRANLEKMKFGQTADSVAALGNAAAQAAEQLTNLPQGFKEMVDYLAYVVQTPAGPGGAGLLGAGGVVVAGNVYVDAHEQTPSQMFEAIKTQAQLVARSLTGSSTNASETFNH